MLAELALRLATPASWRVRRVGLLSESVGLWSRGRRRRAEWGAHEAHCHAVVREAMKRLPTRRTIIILGSGFLRDVPIGEIERAFERIILVDAVHPLATRLRARRSHKFTLLSRDLSGGLGWLLGDRASRIDPVGDLVENADVDLVVSANLLSQLPIAPEQWLQRNPARAGELPPDFIDGFVGWHLADLARFRCPVSLLTDVVMEERARDGVVTDTLDLLRGQVLPPSDSSWDWAVAPFGELEREHEYIHRVQGYADLAAAHAAVTSVSPSRSEAA